MKFCPKQLTLYAVTSRQWLNGNSLTNAVMQAIKGGATMIQLREKNLSPPEYLNLAIQISQVCHTYNIPFIVNDSLEVALQSNADGIHIGQKDCSVDQILKKWHHSKPIIGLSVQTFSQALQAQKKGVDYIGVGSMYPTNTKKDAINVSFNELQQILKIKLPTCVIGGIHMQQLEEVFAYPIDGVALISEIFNQPNILEHTQEIKKKILFYSQRKKRL